MSGLVGLGGRSSHFCCQQLHFEIKTIYANEMDLGDKISTDCKPNEAGSGEYMLRKTCFSLAAVQFCSDTCLFIYLYMFLNLISYCHCGV